MPNILSNFSDQNNNITEFVTIDTDDGWTIKKFNDHTFIAFINKAFTNVAINTKNTGSSSLYYAIVQNAIKIPSGLNYSGYVAGQGNGSQSGGCFVLRVYPSDDEYFSIVFNGDHSVNTASVTCSLFMWGTW